MTYSSVARTLALSVVVAWNAASAQLSGSASHEGFVTVDSDVQIYYRVLGSGRDTVVVPAAAWWGAHVGPISESRTVILYDPRARGKSTRVADSRIGMQHEIADLEALRQHFRLSRMSLIGWSYLGAMVALYAIEHPDRINRVVMVGPLSPRREPYWAQYQADLAVRADTAMNRRVDEMRRAGRDRTDPVSFCAESYRAMLAATLRNRAATERVLASGMCTLENEWPWKLPLAPQVASWGRWDWRERARTLHAPVLIIHGDGDNLPLAGSREWASSLGNARVLVLREAGHFPMAEQPETFFAAVMPFLSGEWPPGAERVTPP